MRIIYEVVYMFSCLARRFVNLSLCRVVTPAHALSNSVALDPRPEHRGLLFALILLPKYIQTHPVRALAKHVRQVGQVP